MSSKRPHSKSRLGCQQCKKRRVKCDQTPPCCLNCAKRGIECEYQEWHQLLTPESFGSSILRPLGRSPSPSELALAHAQCFELRDLGYLHHFTLHTSQTLDSIGSETYRHIWQHDVPLLAVSHPPLMHVLLAFAAAHQATMNEQPPYSHQASFQAARWHFSRALVLFRAAVKEVTDEKPDVLLCYCILVCFLTLFFEFDKPVDERDPIGDFVSLLTILASSISVLKVVQEPLKPTLAGRLLDHTQNRQLHEVAPEANASIETLETLLVAYQGLQGFEPGKVATLSDALQKLRWFYALIDPRPSSWAHLLTWPIKLHPEFAALVQERNPIAICAVAHWMVPAHHAPAKWYIGDWPKRTMNSIAQQLNNEQWGEGIRWPLKEILG